MPALVSAFSIPVDVVDITQMWLVLFAPKQDRHDKALDNPDFSAAAVFHGAANGTTRPIKTRKHKMT